MAQAVRDKTKLLNRIRRIRGQVSAIEALLENEAECGRVLHTIAACRGAIDSLQAELLEDHIRYHVVDPEAGPESEQVQAAEELVDLLRSYLR